MKCSRKMTAFIYGGVAACAGLLGVAAFSPASGNKGPDPEIVASQGTDDPYFKKMNEISGIALAGFRDEQGGALLWGHEEKTSHLVLIRTRPGGSLYAGAVTLPGQKTRDAEDIATVHGHGKNTIYLEDAGSNRKDMPVCLRYARKPENPGQCTVADSIRVDGNTKDRSLKKDLKGACLARGGDWIFLNETDYLEPGAHPAIRRIPEPSYRDALRGHLTRGAATIEFEYPEMCGARRCREFPGDKMSDISAAYNTESLAAVEEPDGSHTAYLFSKVHRSLGHLLKKQHPGAATCKFDSDGLSDAFRLRNIDTLAPGKLHVAEYVTTLDLSTNGSEPGMDDSPDRVTAANFLQMSANQGLLLVRTIGHAYKWPVAVSRERQSNGKVRAEFDVAGALKTIKPLMAAVPAANEKEGVGRRNQEAAAQLDESTIYYMSECRGLPRCALTMVHDSHPYLAGDVDGDGNVDAGDIEALKAFLAGETALYCKAAADMNGDDAVNRDDLEYLERYVAGKGPAPVAKPSHMKDPPALSCGYYNAANPRDAPERGALPSAERRS